MIWNQYYYDIYNRNGIIFVFFFFLQDKKCQITITIVILWTVAELNYILWNCCFLLIFFFFVDFAVYIILLGLFDVRHNRP